MTTSNINIQLTTWDFPNPSTPLTFLIILLNIILNLLMQNICIVPTYKAKTSNINNFKEISM